MKTLKRVLEWLVKSSADASKWSLTVKAVLYGLIPVAVHFLGLANIQIGSDALTQVVDSIAQFIVVIGGVITGSVAAVGLIRKIWTTLAGENDVIAGWEDEY